MLNFRTLDIELLADNYFVEVGKLPQGFLECLVTLINSKLFFSIYCNVFMTVLKTRAVAKKTD